VKAVWAMPGDLNGLPGWLEFVRASRLSDDGRKRHVETPVAGAVLGYLPDAAARAPASHSTCDGKSPTGLPR